MDQVHFGDRSLTIVAERTVREALGLAISVMLTSAALIVAALIAASVVGVLTVRQIVRPIEALASTAQAVADGDFTARASVSGRDEIGALARTFNTMTEQLESLFGTLGQRVSERTRVLQATTEVSRAISVQLDPNALVREVVELVRERFGLYYVGLFAIDSSGEWAVLQAGTGTFGQMMLVQEHRLRVGGESMIGQCIMLNEPAVLMDTDEASVRFDNPLLPDTRSELALPMRSRGRVVGAMTVQSDQPSAFDQAYINALQSMADQVATAMDNAQLFSEAQGALADLEAAQQRYAGRVWTDYTQERGVRGYAQTRRGMLSLHQQILPEVRQAMAAQRPIIGRGRSAQGIRSAIRPLMGSSPEGGAVGERASPSALVAPILVGNQPIGALGLRDAEGVREWNEADIELVQAISAQFSEAAENLRLLEQTQQRESVERVTREVTEEIRAAATVEDAVQRTLRALGRALGVSRMMARLGARRDLVEQTRKGAEHE
jgi:GAF domain-containing protein/HAMP domain-containing protein